MFISYNMTLNNFLLILCDTEKYTMDDYVIFDRINKKSEVKNRISDKELITRITNISYFFYFQTYINFVLWLFLFKQVWFIQQWTLKTISQANIFYFADNKIPVDRSFSSSRIPYFRTFHKGWIKLFESKCLIKDLYIKL